MKKCPFCGYDKCEKESIMQNKEIGFRWMRCLRCGATGRRIPITSEENAEFGWEQRPIEAELRNCSTELLQLIEEHGSRVMLAHATQILKIRVILMEL